MGLFDNNGDSRTETQIKELKNDLNQYVGEIVTEINRMKSAIDELGDTDERFKEAVEAHEAFRGDMTIRLAKIETSLGHLSIQINSPSVTVENTTIAGSVEGDVAGGSISKGDESE